MIVVYAQWHSEIMTVLQGDFEEELRRMSVCGSPDAAHRYELEVGGQGPIPRKEHELLRVRYFRRRARRS
jgi:hypothetical protein